MGSLTNGQVNGGGGGDCGDFEFKDPDLLPQVFTNLNKLRKNKQFCDVVFQLGKGAEVAAHRAVLASASPFLLDLLSREPSGLIKLGPTFEPEPFEALVAYCYTGQLAAPASQLHQLFITAHRLRLTSALRRCGTFLVQNLRPSNCISIRSLQGLASDPDLVTKVDNYIRQNFEAVQKSKELLSLSTVRVEVVQDCSEHKATINPRRLCGLILDWLRHEGHSPSSLDSRVHLLYMTTDHGLRDCNEIASGDCKDTELVQDYKKLTRRVNGGGGSTYPAVSRHFLYSKSDSQSSLSSVSEDGEPELEWRVIASLATGDHKVVGLLIADGKLLALSVSERLDPTVEPRGVSPEAPCYNPIPPMSSPRCSVGTAPLMGKLMVCGGYDRGECIKTAELYDAETNSWTMLKPMRVPRGRFDITVVNNKVYAIGGSDGTTELSSAECYDAATGEWTKLPPAPFARSNAGVCSLDGKIYVVGGWNGQPGLTHSDQFARCDTFDPETRTWSNIANLKTGRNQCGVAAMNGSLYAVGGCEAWNCHNTVEKYNSNSGSWSYVAPMATPRRGCGVAPFKGRLYVIGGHDGVHSLCTTEIYDPETDTWSPGPSLTACRANVGVAVVGDRIYAVGGFNGKAFLNTIEFLDPHLNEWTAFVPGESAALPPMMTTTNNHHSAE